MQRSPFQNIRPILRDFRLFESSHIDDTRDRIARILQEHRLIPGRATREVRSHMDFLAFDNIGIGTLRYGSPMVVDVTGLSDYHVLIFCLSGSGMVRAGDQRAAVNTRWGFFARAGEPFRARFSGDCEQLVVRLRQDCLPGSARSTSDQAGIDLANHHNRNWIETLASLSASASQSRTLRSARFEDRFIDALLESRIGRPRMGRPMHSIGPHSVHRAERFIAANYSRPITFSEIVSASGVQPRTLHVAFKRFRGTTPMEFLKNVRLDRARERLVSEPVMPIGATARACGIAHIGRFSRDYAMRFGEPPSATMRAMKR